MVDIPRIKFFAQRRDRANWPFVDGHELIGMGDAHPTTALNEIWAGSSDDQQEK
jgi:hypothetical protein